VYKYVLQGWPRKIDYCFKLKDSLCTHNDCFIFSDRIIVPELLKNKILKIQYKNHEGTIRMNIIARSVLWYKNMKNDIKKLNLVKCVKYVIRLHSK